MKMTKRVLLTAAVMAAAAFGFMGCGDADDDDPNEMFSSGVNNFDIEYNNTDSSVSRGVNVTAGNHKGAFIKATMEKQDGNGGVLGFMWDITVDGSAETAEVGNTKPWSFWLIGLNYGTASNSTTSELKYYVSKYKNVTDKQAPNFGATTAANLAGFNAATGVSEYVKKTAFTSFVPNGGVNGAAAITNTTDKAWTVYIDIAQSVDTNGNVDGGFTVRLYDPVTVGDASKVNETEWGNKYLAKIDITPSETGYTSSSIKQKQLGVYANVYGNSYVKGSFKYADTYAQAEVAEADAE